MATLFAIRVQAFVIVYICTMEKIDWKVEGMTCSNCALSVSTYLTKQGLQNVQVNPITGDVEFDKAETIEETKLKEGIKKIGYSVKEISNNNIVTNKK